MSFHEFRIPKVTNVNEALTHATAHRLAVYFDASDHELIEMMNDFNEVNAFRYFNPSRCGQHAHSLGCRWAFVYRTVINPKLPYLPYKPRNREPTLRTELKI